MESTSLITSPFVLLFEQSFFTTRALNAPVEIRLPAVSAGPHSVAADAVRMEFEAARKIY
jgi:hypothetical protein